MSKEDRPDIMNALTFFDPEIAERVLWLRDFAWDNCPGANELIYDNYNALAIGWSLTEKSGAVVCNIAIYRSNQNIQFGFFAGEELPDPENRLIGQGKQYRYLVVKDLDQFPQDYMRRLIAQARDILQNKMKDAGTTITGRTILKSVSANKRTIHRK
ncbi:MAG: hypothetical protein KDC57_01190 [Saprospiraceae bacterium]|nr:hypothetical protein [Saprospiraceae bacterium]